MTPAEPQVASQGLQFPGFPPIKPLPTIRDVVAQTRQIAEQVRQADSHPAEASPVPQESAETALPPEETPATAPSQEEIPSETDRPAPEPALPEPPQDEASFETCWQQMVDVIFQKKPAFYHQLRDYPPRYEDDVVYVDVENDFQKNQLEMSKRSMLEYWRNHFALNVNDIEFVIHEHEKKKVIYTSEDKVANMLEQNPELKDFLQVLNFRIKD